MPPKEEKKKPMKVSKTAPIDIDGAMFGFRKMGLNNVKKQGGIQSDDSDDEIDVKVSNTKTYGKYRSHDSDSGSESGYDSSDDDSLNTTGETVESEDEVSEVARRLRMENLVFEARKKDHGVKPTKQLKKFIQGKNITNGRINALKFPIIQDDGDDELSLHYSAKGSGFDENFQTASFAHGANPTLKNIDSKIGADDDETTFREAFVYSRIRTHEYIHTGGTVDKETNSHVGGLYAVKSGKSLSSKRTAGMHNFHVRRQKFVRQVIDSVIDLMAEEKKVPKEIEKLEGSLEIEQKELAKIRKEKTRDRDKIARKQEKIEALKKKLSKRNERLAEITEELPDKAANAPKEATVEALDFVVQNTIGYRDNTDYKGEDSRAKKSKIIFKGYTTAGLNLEDTQEREYALKTYQAVRDKLKLTILKFDETLPDSSDDEIIDKINIDKINEALEERGSLTPVRSGTPYSDANLKAVFSELHDADSYEEISQVAAKATPVITPSGKGIFGKEVAVSRITSDLSKISLNTSRQSHDVLSDIELDDSSDANYLLDPDLDFEESDGESNECSDSERSSTSPKSSVSSASLTHLVSQAKTKNSVNNKDLKKSGGRS